MSLFFWGSCGVVLAAFLALAWVLYTYHYATRREFLDHKQRWQNETAFMSSLSTIVMHPSYQAIIRMGDRVLPFIFEDLERNGPEHWFYALTKITGAQPVRSQDAGNLVAMTRIWLDWWEKQKLLE